jgi:hypothetical protein
LSVDIKSDLIRTNVEILKSLHDLDFYEFNEDNTALEYNNQSGSKIMVILTDENGSINNIGTNNARVIHELSEDNQYEKIFVVGESAPAHPPPSDHQASTLLLLNQRSPYLVSDPSNSF